MTTTTATTTANKLKLNRSTLLVLWRSQWNGCVIGQWPVVLSWEQSITNKIIVCVGAHGCSQMGLADRYLWIRIEDAHCMFFIHFLANGMVIESTSIHKMTTNQLSHECFSFLYLFHTRVCAVAHHNRAQKHTKTGKSAHSEFIDFETGRSYFLLISTSTMPHKG